jgi:lipopolysaccharide export system protein LptA
VKFVQGDTLSLTCERGDYDGQELMMHARHNVVLKHRRQTLYTDSLDYDRLYEYAYFYDGGKLVDGKDQLSSDWGEYNTKTREAIFYYDVRMRSPERLIETDTLHYDTRTSTAHITGESQITTKTSVVNTTDGYFDTKTDRAKLFQRSTIVDGAKTITGDTLFYDDKTGIGEGFGNVVYVDKENKNELNCGHLKYNQLTGYGYGTKDALVKDYSQKDTLYMHADSLKIYTYNINTDSVYREVHCFDKVRAYRIDVQAVCDSMVFNSKDSCLTMYRDPIVWNSNRQLIGEKIKLFMNDSTIREAHILGQAFSAELMPDSIHYNQVSSTDMYAYFVDGALRRSDAVGNVCAVYFPVDDKDTTLIGLNYTETDTMKMYLSKERKMEKIWMPKAVGTLYPMTQIPPSKLKLQNFVWFDYIRPTSPMDVFVWRGKIEGTEIKKKARKEVPLQKLE